MSAANRFALPHRPAAQINLPGEGLSESGRVCQPGLPGVCCQQMGAGASRAKTTHAVRALSPVLSRHARRLTRSCAVGRPQRDDSFLVACRRLLELGSRRSPMAGLRRRPRHAHPLMMSPKPRYVLRTNSIAAVPRQMGCVRVRDGRWVMHRTPPHAALTAGLSRPCFIASE